MFALTLNGVIVCPIRVGATILLKQEAKVGIYFLTARDKNSTD